MRLSLRALPQTVARDGEDYDHVISYDPNRGQQKKQQQNQQQSNRNRGRSGKRSRSIEISLPDED